MDASRKDPALPFTHPAFWLGTVFGIGRLPFAPGTWASLVALPIGWFVTGALGHGGIALLALLFIPIGIWATEICARASEVEDPPAIVIDEVVALWAILAFVPREVLFYGLGFFSLPGGGYPEALADPPVRTAGSRRHRHHGG